MKKDPERALEALRAVAWPILRKRFRPDCCIAATKVGLAVLRAFGVAGGPWETIAFAGNGSFMTWSEAGQQGDPPADARFVAVDPDRPAPNGGYNGHLVITGKVRGRGYLLDLSAPQLDRPDKAIRVPEPILLRADDRGEIGPLKLEAGAVLLYEPHPKARGEFEAAKDWTVHAWRQAVHDEIVGELVAAVTAQLAVSR